MSEIVTLTTPVAKPSRASVTLQRIVLDVDQKLVMVQWAGNNGDVGTAMYTTPAPFDHPTQPTGAVLLNTLNTANLTANSLVRRTFTRLIADGYIEAGTVSGTPD